MLNTKQLKVLKAAIIKYGREKQLLILCEEMSELSVEVLKYVNRFDMPFTHRSRLIDEIADVYICLEYLKSILPVGQIDSMIDIKIKKLSLLLDK